MLYEHTGDSSETDSFIYTVADNEGALSNAATVTVVIGETPNVAPTSEDDEIVVAYQSSELVNVLANDDDSDGTLNVATVSVVTAPTKGTATPQADGTIRYEHTSTETGVDSFTYVVSDNDGEPSNVATVLVTVSEQPNVAPTAEDDSLTVAYQSSELFNVLANDGDSDGTLNIATVTLVAEPTKGTATVQENGTIRYEHTSTEAGADSFTYVVSDNDGEPSNVATVVAVSYTHLTLPTTPYV